jgi:hypothetical protein
MNYFGVSSPLLGGILALYPLRNDFGASSPLLGGILALHLFRNDFGASSPLLGGILALHPLRNDVGACSTLCYTRWCNLRFITKCRRMYLIKVFLRQNVNQKKQKNTIDMLRIFDPASLVLQWICLDSRTMLLIV